MARPVKVNVHVFYVLCKHYYNDMMTRLDDPRYGVAYSDDERALISTCKNFMDRYEEEYRNETQ